MLSTAVRSFFCRTRDLPLPVLLTVLFALPCLHGQAQTLTVSAKNASLKQVFAAIKKQTGYVVFYNQQILSGTKPVTLTVINMPLNDLLQLIFTDQPINYLIQDKTITLSRKTAPEQPLLSSVIRPADGIAIDGVIRAENDDLLQGVSIRIKNTDLGTSSDGYGGFHLRNAKEGAILEISTIGYEPVELTVKKTDEKFVLIPKNKINLLVDNTSNPAIVFLTLHMKKSLSILDESQVIAYGRTSRRYSTGSVSTVKSEEIQKQPVMNVLQALEGRVAGLVVTPYMGNSAAPVKLQIRGRNSLNPNALSDPLYVIDGIPQGALNVGALNNQGINVGSVQAGLTNTFGESPLLYMNPRDIESIDVLKDADATAIYGARGANGVILITTKKSKLGPTRFNVNISRGRTTIPKKLKLLNTGDYLAMRREALRNDGITPDIYNAPDLTLWDPHRQVDWQDYFFSPGETSTIDAGVSGGIGQTTYNLSGSLQSQGELMNKQKKTRRGSFAGSISHTSLDQKFQCTFESRLSVTNVDAVPAGKYIFTPPNAPDIYTEKGDFNYIPYRGLYGSNFPFFGLKKPSASKTSTINTSVRLSYEAVKGLTFSVNAGYNFSNNDNSMFYPAASFDPLFGGLSQAYFGKSSTNNWLIEPQVQYRTFLGSKGSLSVQLGGSLQDVNNQGLSIISLMFPNDNLINSPNNAAFSQLFEGSGEYKYLAGFAIVNYRWNDKYIVNLNGRRDGSSRFGPGRQFGNFGSVGLAWIVSEEPWMKKILPSWFTFVKFRTSYGSTGSDNVGDYEYLTRWAHTQDLTSPSVLYDYNGTPSFTLIGAVNKDYRWESTSKFEAAASFGFLKDRINVEAGYYRNRTSNQLTMVNTPLFTGFGSVRANWPAVVQNAGLEVSMNGRILDTKDWHLSASFNLSVNRNKLVRFPGLESSAYADQYAVGKSLNLKYLYHYIGIAPATGDFLLEDHNKDGVVSYFQNVIPNSPQDDRYIVYDLDPRYTGGFGMQVGYRSFAVSGLFSFCKQLAPDPYYGLQIGSMQNVFIPKDIADHHWRRPGDHALYPKYTTGLLNNAMMQSDRHYTDASYLKLGTVAFSYDLPAKLLNKAKIQTCRLSVNVQNLLTITSYRGIDPQIPSLLSGTPLPRTMAAMLNFTF